MQSKPERCLILNFTRQEYLSPEDCGEGGGFPAIYASHGGVLLLLAILLADGNGQGGGDLRSDATIIGTWRGNRLAIVNETVTDSALSQIGVEQVPLYEQAKVMWKNVTAEAIEAVKQGGESVSVTQLNPLLNLSLDAQRKRLSFDCEVLSGNNREKPLKSLTDLMGLFGYEPALGDYTTMQRLQAGINEFAVDTGQPQRYTVKKLVRTYGVLPRAAQGYRSHKGTTRLVFTLVPEGKVRGNSYEFDFLNGNAPSANELIAKLFPEFKWEKEGQLLEGFLAVIKEIANKGA